MDLRYLVLVAAGFALSTAGFYMLGRGRPAAPVSGLVFLAGVVSLVLGILLTCVPGFFEG